MKKSMLLVIIFAFNTNDYYSQLINFLDPSRGATVAGLSIDYFGPDLSMGMQNQNCFQGLLPNIGAALCSLSDLDSPINSVKPLGTDLFSADPCCSSFPIRSSWWSSSIANYWGYMVVDLGGDRTFNELKVFQSMYYSYNNTFERRGKVTHAQMFTFTLPTASAPSSSSIGWAAVSPAFIVSEGSLDVGNNRTTVIYPTSSTFPRITARYVMFKFKNDGRYHITPPPGKDSNPYDLMVRGIKLFNLDEIPPTARCKNAIVYLDANGNGILNAINIDDDSYDASGIAFWELSQTTFTGANIGNNNVTLTVTDNFGNTASCSAVVKVVDNVPPIAICKPITVYLDANGTFNINASALNNGSTDACGIASFSASQNAFTCANIGTNSVTLTVTDNFGNTASCSSVVTVVDNIPPIAICKPITV